MSNTPAPDIRLFERQAKVWSLIPLNGKAPVESGWQKWCETKRDFHTAAFEGRNAGVACGPASGVLVLDVDDEEAFQAIVAANGLALPATYTVRTGSGRHHYYFLYPDDGRRYGNKAVKHPIYPKHGIFDLRGIGGQVVAAGSIHPGTGQPYTIERGKALAPAPDWILTLYSEAS